jgi:hypothetical protein
MKLAETNDRSCLFHSDFGGPARKVTSEVPNVMNKKLVFELQLFLGKRNHSKV